ncbi:MAG TPA: Ig-like domain-containing protein [Polyangiaceae bacterium]
MQKIIAALVLGAGACSGTDSELPEAELSPELVSSTPALGAERVYPAPLWNGKGEEVAIALTFSEPMNLEEELALEASDHTRSVAAVDWSDDRTELTLFVRGDFSMTRPLADETEYWLDLSSLVSDSGAPLAANAGLVDRTLTFTTGRYDALLNHACGHTFFGPFGSVAASASGDLTAPDISTTHVQYSVALREQDAQFGGWLRAKFPGERPYRLYFDAETQISMTRSEGQAEELALEPTPPACPGITHEVTLTDVADSDVFFFVGPEEVTMRRVIVELVPEP